MAKLRVQGGAIGPTRPAIGFKTICRAGTIFAQLHISGELSRTMLELEESGPQPGRCVIVLDQALPVGRATNAAAVIALTLGNRHPQLAGPDLIDASGHAHPGLIPIGIAVLAARAPDLVELRAKALKNGIDVVDFPIQGQQTTDYAEFGARVREVPTENLTYVGVGLYGPRKAVGRIVGRFSLLK